MISCLRIDFCRSARASALSLFQSRAWAIRHISDCDIACIVLIIARRRLFLILAARGLPMYILSTIFDSRALSLILCSIFSLIESHFLFAALVKIQDI